MIIDTKVSTVNVSSWSFALFELTGHLYMCKRIQGGMYNL